jgi:spore maturation protein CgeB/tetratricopeptide (TPR) repeat protein
LLKALLEQAVAYEAKADWDNAAQYYWKGLEIDPNNKDLLLNLAACFFNMGRYEQALEGYVRCHQHPLQTMSEKERILQFILDTFYHPNAMVLQTNYENNIRLLKEYPFNYLSDFPSFDELPCLCIPSSDEKFYILDKKAGSFCNVIDLTTKANIIDLNPCKCMIIVNIFLASDLERILSQTEDPSWINGMKVPVYAIWKDQLFKYACLQVVDYQPLISGGRLVLFDTYDTGSRFGEFFNDYQAYYPQEIIAGPADLENLNNTLMEIFNYRQTMITDATSTIHDYDNYSREYYQKLFDKPLGNLRILFLTSRFTQVVQYTIRDFMNACKRLGIQCCLSIDKSDLHRVSNSYIMDKIAGFQPNVVFTTNYFRLDYHFLPKNIMMVTWVQDPMPQLDSKEHAQGFGPHDYILSYSQHYTQQLVNAGYPPERINQQMVCFDDQVFYPRLEETGVNRYKSEVTICANYNYIPEQIRDNLIAGYPPETTNPDLRRRVVYLFNQLYQMLDQYIQNGGLIANSMQCLEVLKSLTQQTGLTIHEQNLDQLAEKVFLELVYGLQREHVVRAINQAGFQLKLWGKFWESSVEFSSHAMGWVEHGPELAKVYSCSKIVIGAFSHVTAHFRIWEAIACGALVMVRNIPRESDLCDIRDILSDGDGFVFYNDLDDLVQKIRYYLDHEPERQRIVQTGQAKVKECLSYQAAVQRWLDFVKRDLESNHSS